ncbi:VapE domain-containing protein [Bradyrhizobium erythrophlei]|uniref:Predicted P-loop ATPase and inactivated derivatives n=1 Tax=Bradyrhizobium erythrophlei TaxID=1437360 RepID=A0A1M5MVF5_9BRAD|nr:VapE domain-containing protein [Bradyrhizobium erythrophlei]SHG81288.1 Predicted P-loop ATPase and inactivated derivatives [Bradyrhizobium erythrophlei]
MTTIESEASNCNQIRDNLDPFEVYAAEGRAMAIVAEARGVHRAALENDDDHEVFNRISAEADALIETAIKSMVQRSADPFFLDLVINEVCRAIGVAPQPSDGMIVSHIQMLHALAKAADVDGVLTLTRIDAKGNVFTEKFAIGDVENHVNAVIGWSTHPDLNLYVPWAIFRKDMPHWSKGSEENVVAALAFVGDLDADTGKDGTGLDGLPLASPYVIETSAGNYQPVFPLARPLSQAQAKPLAVALGDAVGADSRTKDTSSLFRIAGTLNWPSAKKLGRGRSAVPQLVAIKTAWTGDLVEPEAIQEAVRDFKPGAIANGSGDKSISKDIDWSDVEDHAGWLKSIDNLPPDFNTKGRMIVAHRGNLQDLKFDLEQAGLVVAKPYQSWSEVGFALASILKNDGRFTSEQIAAALMCDLDCNRHVTKLSDDAQRRRAVERMILRSHEPTQQQVRRREGEPDWRERRKDGSPRPSMHNARLAITELGVVCSLDTFHNKVLFGYRDDTVKHELQSIVGEASDHGIIALRQLMSDRFGFDLEDKATRDAVKSLALENCFNPVCDLIDKAEAEWDGVERLDRMAVDYFNCEDTPLNRAFIRKTMIALVSRAREPGCKVDTIPVLESPEGFNKSTAWRVIAGDENYSDEKIIGLSSREVQEQLSEIWIHENADLAGLKKAEIETVKAYASRMTDIARPAFGHFVTKQPRHSIEVGTTNSDEYLQSQTGNRRFWPLKVLKAIDIEKLRRDRLQLIGEAAKYQTKGESVVLDRTMWAAAGIEQEQRRVKDPWESVLAEIPTYADHKYFKDGMWREKDVKIIHTIDGQERVASSDLLEYVLDIPIAQQTTATSMRLSNVMKQLGWERTSNKKVTIGDERVMGYFRWIPAADPG